MIVLHGWPGRTCQSGQGSTVALFAGRRSGSAHSEPVVVRIV